MPTRTTTLRVATAALVILLCAHDRGAGAGELDPPAGAVSPTMRTLDFVEPRTEINGENTPGADGPIFTSTYRITEPGSYYLGGDLAGEAGEVGILVDAPGVTIDLMGFTLVGAPGSLSGVIVDGGPDITIRNGVVRGWGGDGVFAASSENTRFADLRAQDNAGDGLRAGGSGIVTGCVAVGNGGDGVSVSANSVVSDCVSRDNGALGFLASSGVVMTGCVAEGNGGDGVLVGVGSSVIDCVARNNDGDGVRNINFEAMMLRCVASLNGQNGIAASGRCFVRENTCERNGQIDPSSGAGVRVSATGARVEENHCADNVRGLLASGSGTFIAGNTCSGNTVANWDVDDGNVCHVVFANPTVSTVNGDAGGTFPGNTGAWVNWTH